MDDDEKGKRFLKLIDDQNNLQWKIVAKLSAMIASKWNSVELQHKLETLIKEHSEITKEINSLDEKGSIL